MTLGKDRRAQEEYASLLEALIPNDAEYRQYALFEDEDYKIFAPREEN